MAGKVLNISGTAYGCRLDSDMKRVDGFFVIGNTYPFTIKGEKSNVTLPSALKGQRGQVVDSGARIDEVVGSVGKNSVATNLPIQAIQHN